MASSFKRERQDSVLDRSSDFTCEIMITLQTLRAFMQSQIKVNELRYKQCYGEF